MSMQWAFGRKCVDNGGVPPRGSWRASLIVALLAVPMAFAAEPATDAGGPGLAAADSRDGEIVYRSGQFPPDAKPGEAWFLYMYPQDGQEPGRFVTEKVRLPVAPEVGESSLPAMALPEVVAVTVRPAHAEGRVVPPTFLQKSVPYQRVAPHHPGAVLKNEELSVVVAPAYVERKWRPARFESRELDIRAAAERRPAETDDADAGWPAEEVPAEEDPDGESAERIRVFDLAEAGSVEETEVPEKRLIVTVRVVEKDGDPTLELVPAEMGEYTVRELMEPSAVIVTEKPAEIVWRRVYATLPEAEIETAVAPFRYVDLVRPGGPLNLRQLEQARIVWRKRPVPVQAAAGAVDVRPILTRADWERVLGDAPAGGSNAAFGSSIVFPREETPAEFAAGPMWPNLPLADTVDAAAGLSAKEAMAKGMEYARNGQYVYARPYWEFAAKRRDAEAWYRLGDAAKTGIFGDGQADPRRAEACWSAAARLGSVNAWLALGDLYSSGLLGAPDWTRAVDAWIEAFHKKEQPSGARDLAYKRLREFVQVRWNEIAPGANNATFEKTAGLNLLRRNHPRLAGILLKRTVNRGGEEYFAEALIAHNGWNADGRPDYAEARSLLNAAASRHHPGAKACLAVMMDGPARDALARQADAGDAAAAVKLAQYAYTFGDHVTAAKYARQVLGAIASATAEEPSADADDAPAPGAEAFAEYAAALRILGLTLAQADPAWYARQPETGLVRFPTAEVRSRLDRTGLLLLERAALLGDVEALYMVGDVYRHGKRGMAANMDRAFASFERAAAQNDARAMLALAEMFANGEVGQADPVRAYTLASAASQRPGLGENVENTCKRIQTSCSRRFSAKRLEICAAQSEALRRAATVDDRARALDRIVWRAEGFLPERPATVKLPATAVTAVPVMMTAGANNAIPNPEDLPVQILPLPDAAPVRTPAKADPEDVDALDRAVAEVDAEPDEATDATAMLPVEQPFVSGRPPVAKPGETWQLFVYPAVLFRRGEAPIGQDEAAWTDDGTKTRCTLREAVNFLRPVQTSYKEYQVGLPISAPYHIGTVVPERFRTQKVAYEYRPAYRPGAEFVEREFEVVLRPAFTKKTWIPVEFAEPQEKQVTVTPARREWLASLDAEGKTNPVIYTLNEIQPKIEKYTFRDIKADGRVENEVVEAMKTKLKRLEKVKEGDPAQPLRPAQTAEYETQVLVEPAEVRIRKNVVETLPVTVSRDNRESAFDVEKWPEVVRDIPGDVVAVEPARLVWRRVSPAVEPEVIEME